MNERIRAVWEAWRRGAPAPQPAARDETARKAAAWDYLWDEERPRLTPPELAAIERARLLAGLPDPLRAPARR